MSEQLDMSVLRERLEEQRTEVNFYTTALKLLIEVHEVHQHTDLERLKADSPNIDERILAPIAAGAVPLQDDLTRANADDLAALVKDLFVLAGAYIGLTELFESEEESYQEYFHYLMKCKTHEHYVIHFQGFCALSLLVGRAPSYRLWESVFPMTDEPLLLDHLINVGTRTFADCVYNYAS